MSALPQDPNNIPYRVTVLETRFDTILPTLATKTDLAELRAELLNAIHGMETRLQRWMLATTLGLFFGFAAVVAGGAASINATTTSFLAAQATSTAAVNASVAALQASVHALERTIDNTRQAPPKRR